MAKLVKTYDENMHLTGVMDYAGGSIEPLIVTATELSSKGKSDELLFKMDTSNAIIAQNVFMGRTVMFHIPTELAITTNLLDYGEYLTISGIQEVYGGYEGDPLRYYCVHFSYIEDLNYSDVRIISGRTWIDYDNDTSDEYMVVCLLNISHS